MAIPRADSSGTHRAPKFKPVAWFRGLAGNMIALNQD
jgi:hypothetical protein